MNNFRIRDELLKKSLPSLDVVFPGTVFFIANTAILSSILNMFLRFTTIIAATTVALSLSSCCCL